MAGFIIRNLTNKKVILPSPVGYELKPNEKKNLSEVPGVKGAEIVAIKSVLMQLEQDGKIDIPDADNIESAIEALAEGADQPHPLTVKDAMAEDTAIQIPAWNGTTGSAGVPKTMKLCLTDDGGAPQILSTHQPTMTLTVSGVTNAKVSAGEEIAGGATDTAQVKIVRGMASFTVQGDAGTMDIVISGAAPDNVVTGVTLAIINDGGSPYQVVIS